MSGQRIYIGEPRPRATAASPADAPALSPQPSALSPPLRPTSLASLAPGGLAPEINEREIEEEFGRFGRIQKLWVARKPPGFGEWHPSSRRSSPSAGRAPPSSSPSASPPPPPSMLLLPRHCNTSSPPPQHLSTSPSLCCDSSTRLAPRPRTACDALPSPSRCDTQPHPPPPASSSPCTPRQNAGAHPAPSVRLDGASPIPRPQLHSPRRRAGATPFQPPPPGALPHTPPACRRRPCTNDAFLPPLPRYGTLRLQASSSTR
jgi:hypothetical protein